MARAGKRLADDRARPSLGAALKRLRQERGLTLSTLARETGLPQSTLSKVENGQMSLNYDKLVSLAEAFEVDIRQLFTNGVDADGEAANLARRVIDRRSDDFGIDDHYRYQYLSVDLRNRLMLPLLLEVSSSELPDEQLPMMNIVGQRFAFVIEGPIDFLCEHYETVTLYEGDSLYIDSAMPHAFVTRNGRSGLVLTVLASGNPEYLELARQAALARSADASNAFRERRKARRPDAR